MWPDTPALSGLAGLPPAGADRAAATGTQSVAAVPSAAVAEGPDSELAALVGRGDQLTDVLDVAALPGHPCRVSWTPYYSLEFNRADTSSSDVEVAVSGGWRLLSLRGTVSGDFLGRPVRGHTVPADAATLALLQLRYPAAAFPERVELAPGCPDDGMDRWPVPVPADVRGVLREIGAVRISGLPDLLLLPGAKEHEVAPETHTTLGGDGTYRPLARISYGRSRRSRRYGSTLARGRGGARCGGRRPPGCSRTPERRGPA